MLAEAQEAEAAPPPPPLLLDLDNEHIALALGTLAARDQARAARVCKLFSLLVGENQKDETFLVSCVTHSVEETRTVLAPKMLAPPTVGVLFSNERGGGAARRHSIRELVRSLPPEAHIIGAEVHTLVGSTPEGKIESSRNAGFALSLGAFPEATAHAFAARGSGAHGSLRSQLEEQRAFEAG